MKKILTLLLCLIIFITVMSSCASEDNGDNDTTTSDTIAETDTEPIETEPLVTETTTEKETEPPKEYEYISVFRLDFTSMETADIPFSKSNVDNLRIEDGILKGTSTSGDPHINYTGDMALDASTIQEIHIKLMNYSEDSNFQFFFTTETVSWSEGASVKDYLYYSGYDGDKNDWNDIVIYPNFSSDWDGTITSFRLDPFSSEGDFEVEYVEFFTVTEK